MCRTSQKIAHKDVRSDKIFNNGQVSELQYSPSGLNESR